MSTVNFVSMQRAQTLTGQTVLVIGGSAGIGLEMARSARAESANVILTARDPERLHRAATEVDAHSTAAFAAADFKLLDRFFHDLPEPVNHILVTAPGRYYAPRSDFELDKARCEIEALFIPKQFVNRLVPGVENSNFRFRGIDQETKWQL